MQNNDAAKRFVIKMLEEQIPTGYHYHNVDHTLYVVKQAAFIGQMEDCSSQQMVLLDAAALWHDAGFIHTYNGHEEESCRLAREQMPHFGFLDEDIETVCGIIMATRYPQQPQTKLECILADADLEYLGTENAAAFAQKLYEELKEAGMVKSLKEWNKTQLVFLETHRYHTAWCKKHREPAKQQYLKTLLQAQEKH